MQQCTRRQRRLTIEHRHLIEHNPWIVRKLRARGLPALLGSGGHSVSLDRASVAEARTCHPLSRFWSYRREMGRRLWARRWPGWRSDAKHVHELSASPTASSASLVSDLLPEESDQSAPE